MIQGLTLPTNGFYTEEERKNERRIGFLMNTLSGEKGWLAHQDIESKFSIRRYGVSIENIEKLAVPAITPVKNNIIILDEIGKMECFSPLFKQAALKTLDSPNVVVGTITFGGDEFIQSIKNRDDIEIIEVTMDNRNFLPDMLLEKISYLFST